MEILLIVCLIAIVGVIYLAVGSAFKGDYPGRKAVEKAIEEKRRRRR